MKNFKYIRKERAESVRVYVHITHADGQTSSGLGSPPHTPVHLFPSVLDFLEVNFKWYLLLNSSTRPIKDKADFFEA